MRQKEHCVMKTLHFDFMERVPEDHISQEFIQLMLNRMAVGFYKHGHFKDCSEVDFIENARLRLKLYQETGNKEHLVDAANYLMGEFSFPKVAGAYFQTHDNASPGVVGTDGKITRRRPETV